MVFSTLYGTVNFDHDKNMNRLRIYSYLFSHMLTDDESVPFFTNFITLRRNFRLFLRRTIFAC
ncbi:uncharacterized protein Dvar_82470 [Desulfosarcina variabilis str. Montpellier]